MIESFEELKAYYQSGGALRHISARTAAVAESDFPGADGNDPEDSFLDTSPLDEVLQFAETDSASSTLDPVPADEAASETASDCYIDFGLSSSDMQKMMESGVRPKDAIEAGLRHVTSSESAFALNRTDTGQFEGILLPYPVLGPGISHCWVHLENPVILKTSKGKPVSILQPVRST